MPRLIIVLLGLTIGCFGARPVAVAGPLLLSGRTANATRLTFSPDGRRLATAGADGTVRLWDVATERQSARLDADGEGDLKFSRDGWALGAAGLSGNYRLWEVETADELVSQPQQPGSVRYTCATLSGELSLLALGTASGHVRLIETATGLTVRSIEAFTGLSVGALAFSPGGESIAVAPGASAGIRRVLRPTVTLWNIQSGKLVRELMVAENAGRAPHPGSFTQVVFSPDGRTVATVHSSQGLILWNLEHGNMLYTLPGQNGDTTAFSPDGRTLARVTSRGRVVAGRTERIEQIEVIESASGGIYRSVHPKAPVTAIALAPRSDRMAIALRGPPGVVIEDIGWPQPRLNGGPHEEDLKAAWQMLIMQDARAAHEAIWSLISAEDRTVRLLEQCFEAAGDSDAFGTGVRRLIKDLGDREYGVRSRAMLELRKIGPPAAPVLAQALARIIRGAGTK